MWWAVFDATSHGDVNQRSRPSMDRRQLLVCRGAAERRHDRCVAAAVVRHADEPRIPFVAERSSGAPRK